MNLNVMMDFDISQLKEISSTVYYPKNFILVKEGNQCNKIWLLERGSARYIYYHENKELTGWIDLEGDIVGSVYCILGLGAARETIQLMEDSELLEIKVDDIKKDEVVFADFKNKILQHYFIELENRIKFFQSLDGKERYEFILKHKPNLIQRVPLHILSSFIGMTPESLSRIRSALS